MMKWNEYRDLIYSSPLFELENEERFQMEEKKVIGYLYGFLVSWDRRCVGYAVEIVETAKYCIEFYRRNPVENAIFDLPWRFRFVWLKKFSFYKKKERQEWRLRGIAMSDPDFAKILSYERRKGWERDQEQIAKELRISGSKLAFLRELQRVYTIDEYIAVPEGGTISIFDILADETSTADGDLYDHDAVDCLLSQIANVFDDYQPQRKPLMADLITSLIWEVLSERDDCEKYAFVSAPMLDCCREHDRSVPQKYIAEKYGITPRAITVLKNDFRAKLDCERQSGGNACAS